MDPKKKLTPLDLMPDISNVVSNTECTGIMPALPADQGEWAEELELFSNEIPSDKQPPSQKKKN